MPNTCVLNLSLAIVALSSLGWAGVEGAVQRGEERFRWRGQVDGVDEIRIRGESVRVEHVQAKPIQRQDYRFSAPLPSREVKLKLRKIKGRGKVRLLEEPTAWNDYTAVVRIDDGKQGGDEYYEFELTWKSDDWDDWDDAPWDDDRHGNRRDDDFDGGAAFRWEGKVDIGAVIEISGDQHRVEDLGGRGIQERRARFTEPLPERDLAVSLRKIDGRGRVELLETPSAGNGYKAVVRIDDPKGGSDIYQFELTWRRR